MNKQTIIKKLTEFGIYPQVEEKIGTKDVEFTQYYYPLAFEGEESDGTKISKKVLVTIPKDMHEIEIYFQIDLYAFLEIHIEADGEWRNLHC